MFRIRLVREIHEDRVTYRVGRVFRVVNLVAALFLVGAGYALDTAVVPGLLAILALLGACYEESAVLDRRTGRAEFRVGLLLLHKTTRVGLAEIAEVRISTFDPAKFTSFELGLVDGKVLTIENDRGRASAERLANWARELSVWLDRPLWEPVSHNEGGER